MKLAEGERREDDAEIRLAHEFPAGGFEQFGPRAESGETRQPDSNGTRLSLVRKGPSGLDQKDL